jgi:hypothetical protein
VRRLGNRGERLAQYALYAFRHAFAHAARVIPLTTVAQRARPV